jgi:hypothetical protein
MERLINLPRPISFSTVTITCWKRRCAMAVIALTLALISLAADGALHIQTVKQPIFVTVNVGPVESVISQSSARREALLDQFAGKVIAAAGSNPDRVIALKPGDFALSFNRLPDDTQAKLAKSLRQSAPSSYEATIATILQQVLARVRNESPNIGLSVHGLPLETRDGAATNTSYAALIEQLDAIVSARTIIVGGGAETEPTAVRRSLANALRMAGSRPVYYLCNGQWHCLTFDNTPGAMDVYPPANFESSAKTGGTASPGDSVASAAGALGEGDSTSSPNGSGGSAAEASSGGGGGGGGGAEDGSSGGGGGGGGGGTTGGGGSDSGGAGPLGPPNAGGSVTRLWIMQKTSSAVKGIYSSYAAKDCYSIYQGEIDPDNDGLFEHPDLLEQGLIREVPPDYTGPVSLDWEGVGMDNLGPEVNQDTFNQQLVEFIKVLQKARQVRPNAKFGFYGLPHAMPTGDISYWEQWTARLQPLFDQSDCILPSIYRVYQDNQPYWSAEINKQWVQRKVKLALEVSNGKPVYPVIWHRFHEANENLAYQLIPAGEFKIHTAAAFGVEHNGRKADGVLWWGADQYFYWVAVNYPDGTSVEFPDGDVLAQVFANEMAPGETPAQYFNRIHKRIIRRLSDVLTNAYPQ